MKVFIDKKMFGRDNYQSLLDEFEQVDFIENLDDDEVEVMIVMNSTIKNLDFKKYRNLKWIQLLMAGFDNLNIEEIKKQEIMISNARDIFSISIAEDVFSKILYFNRNTKYYLDSMKSKKWEPIKKEPEIFNSIVGILGTGSIGQEIAKRMKAFGAQKVLGYKRTKSSVPFFDEIFTDDEGLDYLIKNSDYLILALPLNDETIKILDSRRITLMKSNALLINIARGDVIDQEALIEALKHKQIRGAGLDVTSPEPLPKTSELWNLDNVFITPHNASSSPYMKDRLYEMTRINLYKYLKAEKPNYIL
jgi:phosphoglycerate dehydrogenase-like enzyme